METRSRKLAVSFLLTFTMLIGLFAFAPFTAFAQGGLAAPAIVSVGGIEVDQETNMGGAPSAMIGQPYSAQIVATGGYLTYSAGAGEYMKLPDGLSIDAETGLISGICTETEMGRHNVYITVSNAMGTVNAVIGMWVVDDSVAPIIETGEGQLGEAVYVNSFASFTVTLANDEATYLNDLQWSLKEGSLPDGMSLSYVKTQTVYIQGEPTQAGTYEFTLKAENEIGSAERTFRIVVREGSVKPTIIDYNELPYAIQGKPYEDQLRASGTNTQEDPIIWSYNDTEYSQDSYDLGNGLTLSNTGLISGTPTESGQPYFEYIHAKNSNGSDSQSAYIIIHANGEVTSIVVSPAETVVEKGGSLQFTAEIFGYGDVSQTVESWDTSMWYEPLNSWFPRPTSEDTKVENGLLTVGEDEERTQIMVVAIAGGEKGYAMVTIVEKGTEIYTVSFDANGGTGDMASVPVVENGTYELPVCTLTAPDGYEFKCWSVNDTEKAVGDEIIVNADTIVTAVWEKKAHVHSYDGSYTHDDDAHWKQCSDPMCPDLEGSITDTAFCTSAEAVNCITAGNCDCGNTIYGDHDFENGTIVMHNDEYHVGKCAYCDAINNDYNQHTGGTATCTERATCTACGEEYGITASHSFVIANGYKGTDGHANTCSCGAHDTPTAHTGGMATCTAKAKCSVCNTEYGTLAAHTPNADDGNCTTALTCSICSEVITAAETAHSDENSDGKCDLCNKDMPTSGGGTSGTTPDPIPNPTPDTTPDPDDEKDGLSGGAIAGIVVGSTAVVGAGGFSAVWFGVQKKTFGDLKNVFKKLGKKIAKKLAKKTKKSKTTETSETPENEG